REFLREREVSSTCSTPRRLYGTRHSSLSSPFEQVPFENTRYAPRSMHRCIEMPLQRCWLPGLQFVKMPRRLTVSGGRTGEHSHSGHSLCTADIYQIAWTYSGCGADAGSRDRREHCAVFHRQGCPVESAFLSAIGPTRGYIRKSSGSR